MTSAMPPHARPFSGDEAAGRLLTSEGLVSQALVALGLIGPGEAEALQPLLARCRRVEVAAGTVVLAGHSANSCAAILLAGRLAVQLRAGAGPEMGSVAVGELVGEVSALTGSPTSAWVIASEPSALLELERDTLLELANRSHQFAVRMLRTVCERLYSSNLQALSSDDASREFRRKAFFDQLTGLKNRTWLSQHLPPLLAAQAEHDEVLHLFMVDIDHFKRFNDTWGHAAGDQVLVAVGQALTSVVRPGDHVVRVGGEEILVLARSATVGERLRQAVEQRKVALEGSAELLQVTISVGGARHQPGEPGETTLERADQALYRAKNGGRNRVELDA
jgi:diguanylate cyclase (GGDEF)-like protein